MFYRILNSQPGYPGYMVCEYTVLDYDSKTRNLTKHDGSLFARDMDEAHRMLPGGVKLLPIEADGFTHEIWGSSNE